VWLAQLQFAFRLLAMLVGRPIPRSRNAESAFGHLRISRALSGVQDVHICFSRLLRGAMVAVRTSFGALATAFARAQTRALRAKLRS
jgi:hypothetical protein